MKKELKYSDVISTFLKLNDNVKKEYECALDFVNEKDKELSDLVHKAELETLSQNEKAKAYTEISHNRRDRRYWKNIVDCYEPLYNLQTNSKEYKTSIEQLKQALGKIRKAESYLENRKYKPKARKNQENT